MGDLQSLIKIVFSLIQYAPSETWCHCVLTPKLTARKESEPGGEKERGVYEEDATFFEQ